MTARRKAKRCGHRRVKLRWMRNDGWYSLFAEHRESALACFNETPPDAIVCRTCHAWLPLGPARDDGEHAEAVRIEINAARWATEHDVTNFADAWRCEAFSDAWLLAAEIATHDDTNGGEP